MEQKIKDAIDILTNRKHWDGLEEFYEAEYIIRNELKVLQRYRDLATSVKQSHKDLPNNNNLADAYLAQLRMIEGD